MYETKSTPKAVSEAQRILEERGKGVTGRTDYEYVLSGVVRCGQCGRAMSARHKPSSYKRVDGTVSRYSYYIYECGNKSRTCRRYYVKQSELDEAVFLKLQDLYEPALESNREALRQEIIAVLEAQEGGDTSGQIDAYERRLVELDRTIDRGSRRLLSAPDDIYAELVKALGEAKHERTALAERVEALKAKPAKADLAGRADKALALLQDLIDLREKAPAQQKVLVRRAIRSIELRFKTEHPPPSRPTKKPKPRNRFIGGTLRLAPLLVATAKAAFGEHHEDSCAAAHGTGDPVAERVAARRRPHPG
ncbi:MAG: hypothetical protein CMF76_10215 [Maricaulis sp.]|nr:hypothetical protein [Maricaulis sp.]